jgi:hypothetical protein
MFNIKLIILDCPEMFCKLYTIQNIISAEIIILNKINNARLNKLFLLRLIDLSYISGKVFEIIRIDHKMVIINNIIMIDVDQAISLKNPPG